MNHWDAWTYRETGEATLRAEWTGKAQHHLRQIAHALGLPLRLILNVPPVPAKAAHKRRFGR